MDNLYILTNLLPKYHLGLDVIYHLGLVCSSNRGYLQYLQDIQHHKKSITIYYKNTVLRELLKNHKLVEIKTNANGVDHISVYWRGKYCVDYTICKNRLSAERCISIDYGHIYQTLCIFEYNNFIAIEFYHKKYTLYKMAHPNIVHFTCNTDRCARCILFRVLQYRFHV